jgi:energy-coupling factor transporter ATP-binding protein EcfA2
MSFLSDYMHWTEGTEAPENYHFWSGLSALSAIVSRRVWLDMGLFQIYPNLYTVLLGPAGNGKTTCMRVAKNIVRDIGDIPFSAEAQTKESVVRYMRDNCPRTFEHKGALVCYTPLTIFVTELSHFFGPNSGHMIDFLTTIYDENKYEARTKNKGDDVLEGPYVTLLGCTTQDWVTTYLKSDIIGGGFTRRVIFVNEPSSENRTNRIPFPDRKDSQFVARDSALAHGRILQTIHGEFTWEPTAREFYIHWYKNRDIPKDPDVAGYYRTKHVQLLKIAMLVALSESTELVLQKSHLEVGMALLEKTETTLTRVFQGIGRNELNAIANKVLEILYNSPEIDYKSPDGSVRKIRFVDEKRLRAIMYRDAPGRECDDIINHLISSEKIFRVPITKDNIARTYIGLR